MAIITIIGAGMAGLAAARRLDSAGHTVVVLDKGRGVGGRLATRRIGAARLDHGAQFFTVRSPEFADLVEAAIAEGVVHEWCRGFASDDGHPRYRCSAGMTDLAKWMAIGLDVTTGERVTDLRHHPADAYLVTAPVPQALDLLAASDVQLDPDLAGRLREVTYDPTIAVLATLDGPSAIPAPGAVQDADATFSFVADNAVKGITTTPSVTLHAGPELSRMRWDDDPDAVLADLLEAGRRWVGPARVLEAQLKKWRYATPLNPLAESSVVASAEPLVVLGGDAYGGPKVEGAFRSGRHAAEALLAALGG